MEIELLRFGVAPNTLQRFTFPKRFGQRRTIVRRVGFGTYESYAAFKIDFANAMHGSVSSHSAADNQVLIVLHSSGASVRSASRSRSEERRVGKECRSWWLTDC